MATSPMSGYPSEDENETPSGMGGKILGKGESTVKPPKKSEKPGMTPKGMSAKPSKDDGKAPQAVNPKSEMPSETPDGPNMPMKISHEHMPAIAMAKPGDAVHLHVMGTVSAHNSENGKGHSIVNVKSVKPHGDMDNASKKPLDELRQIIKEGTQKSSKEGNIKDSPDGE